MKGHRSADDRPFNEAPIHESGKYPDSLTSQLRNVPSMRPRFMNRGSLLVPNHEALRGKLLQ